MNPTRKGTPDFLLLILTLLLVGFGLVMVFSASSSITVAAEKYRYDALYFTKKQMTWAAVGMVVMFISMNVRYTLFKKLFIPFFAVVVIMLILVLIIGETRNGAKSWFGFGGTIGVQPTEFAKLAIILYLGALINKKGEKFRDFKKGLIPVMVIVGFVAGLIMLQPDLGSCIILVACAGVIIVAGGCNLKHLFASMGVIIAIASIFISISMLLPSSEDKKEENYRVSRFTAFLNPLEDEQGSGYQLKMSLEAFAHGGATGAGFGKSVQKLFYLPLAYNDFIFAIIAEEFGFIGSMLFILTYLLFLWRGLIVSLRCPDPYGTLVGVGIIGLFGIQALINIGGVSGSIPMTGVTLPFISYGGSSLLISMFSIGILLSISREYNREPQKKTGQRRPLPGS